jgi:hypothetical protein
MEHSRWDCLIMVVCFGDGLWVWPAAGGWGTQGGTALGTDVGCGLLPSRSEQGSGGVVGLTLIWVWLAAEQISTASLNAGSIVVSTARVLLDDCPAFVVAPGKACAGGCTGNQNGNGKPMAR